jgi:hypothetical protein
VCAGDRTRKAKARPNSFASARKEYSKLIYGANSSVLSNSIDGFGNILTILLKLSFMPIWTFPRRTSDILIFAFLVKISDSGAATH